MNDVEYAKVYFNYDAHAGVLTYLDRPVAGG